MKIRIYQVNVKRDTEDVRFQSLARLKNKPIDPSIYDKVYECDYYFANLEEIFQTFNIDKPCDYTGRSMSVSDVIEVEESKDIESGFYFVDIVGFKKIDFDASKTEDLVSKLIEVLIIEPNRAPRIKKVKNELAAFQSIVQGYIEVVYPFEDEVGLICNEEGKLMGFQPNRALYDEDGSVYDIIYGTFIVAGLTKDNFGSLPQELLDKFAKRFANREMFRRGTDGEIKVLEY